MHWNRSIFYNYAVPSVLLTAGGFYLLQDGAKKPSPAPAGAEGQEMPPMPKPGPEHELLRKSVGTWDASVSMFMDPSAPPMVSKGVETITMMGEFWQNVNFTGELMGAPFVGHAFTGYSPYKKKYVQYWIDSTGPEGEMFEGEYNAESKSLTMRGETPNTMMGNIIVKHKAVVHFKDDNTRVFDMYENHEGKDVKVITIEYKRRK